MQIQNTYADQAVQEVESTATQETMNNVQTIEDGIKEEALNFYNTEM